MTTTKKLMKEPRQVEAFRKAARELGCDDNEGKFQDALRTVAKAKPKGTKELRIRPKRNA
jgi:hypothetical protein